MPTASSFTLASLIEAPLSFAAAVVICGLALAGCQTARTAAIDPSAAATEANVASLTAVIAQDPTDPDGYNVRGSAFGSAGRLKEAIADFNKAIELKPDFYQAYANRALVERQMERDDLAFADYNRSIEINPNYAVAYVGRANMYRVRRQLDFALADFDRAIQLDADDPRAYYNRGLLYQSEGRHEPAIADFSKAVALSPQNTAPFNARGLSFLAIADYKSALEDFNLVVTRNKDSYEGWTNQGLALEKLGEPAKAYAAFARAAQLNPQYGPAADGMRRTAPVGQG